MLCMTRTKVHLD